MTKNRKIPTEKEILQLLKKGEFGFPPLTIRWIEQTSIGNKNGGYDALVDAAWEKNGVKFAVECKALSTPKVFETTLKWIKSSPCPKGNRPLLVVPFLSDSQLKELEREKISGVDLCGNGCVTVPGEFSVFRSGQENQFTSSAPIKNIYRKNSSMVGRSFLARPGYKTVQEVLVEINRRNLLVTQGWETAGRMSLSTVSKALTSLEEDLIIDRKDKIRLLQADTLLEKLRGNYSPPFIKGRVRLKVPAEKEKIRDYLLKKNKKTNLPVMAAGVSSVGQYAVMQTGEMFSIYCPDLRRMAAMLPDTQSDRFPNLEILETDDETVYFDARRAGSFSWASPVQTYLELMAGDKRDKETAGQVKSFILGELKKAKP